MDMKDCKLASWALLPSGEIHQIFPDATPLGEMSVDFESVQMTVYRFKDAVGNDAFAFDRGGRLVSHGSQILTSDALSRLRRAGAEVAWA